MKKFFRQMMACVLMLCLLCADGSMLSVADAAVQGPDGYHIFSVKLDGTKKKAVVSFETQKKAVLVVCVFDEEGIELCFSDRLEVNAGETQAEIDLDTDVFPQSYFLRAFLVDSVTWQPLCSACSSPVYTDGVPGSGDDAEKEDGEQESAAAAVNLGWLHSSAVTPDGSLYMWGHNKYGEVGNGTARDQFKPVRVLADVVSVSLGCYYSGAVTKDGSLYMWGNNEYGQLGNGTTSNQSTPVRVLEGVVSVSLGGNQSSAITEDGSLYMWGRNSYGQLGDGTKINQSKPVKVLADVVSVSFGAFHSGAVTKDGSLYMWGWNVNGQLGNGTTNDESKPVRVLGNVVSVSLGGNQSSAVTKDGSLYTWGANGYGQLGDGTEINQSKPVRVLDKVISVSLGANHSGAITKDGSLYMWGQNWQGQLGDGTKINQSTPVRVLDDVVSVSLGADHSGAVTGDGSLYVWGDNRQGQLGDGTTTSRYTPTKITIPISAAAALSSKKQYSNDTGNEVHDNSFVSVGKIVSQAVGKGLMNLEHAASLSAVSVTGGQQTASVTDLEPNGIYNFYILRSLEAADVFDASNVLYMNQYTADSDGNLNVTYKAKSACDAAIQLVVGFGDKPSKITNLTLSVDGSSMNKGATLQLVAEIYPKEAANQSLKWTSSDPDIASVDDKGLVTAKGVGKTTITVETTDGSGISVSCVISVREAPETPTEPETPSKPETPTEPETPSKPETPTEPETPSEPETPTEPETPSEPETPTGPETPSKPETPSTPETPTTPVTPPTDSTSTPPASVTPSPPTNPTPTADLGESDWEAALLYYVVKFNANGGTKLSRKTMTLLFDDNLGILPDVERKNYKFAGWYTQKTGGTKVNSRKVLNASTTLFAHWIKVGRPAQTKLLFLGEKSAGKLQVKYKKVSGASGYEIAYSTNSKFASRETKKVSVKSTSKSLTGLKKNQVYYVKVRAYKVDSTGKKIYGKYSTKKKVSTKK